MRLPGDLSPVDALRRAARQWVSSVPEVPPELEACIGDCDATSCCRAQWESCELRRRHLAGRLAYEARAARRSTDC